MTERKKATKVQPAIASKAKRGQSIERHGTTSGSPGQAVTYANRWRENYNPLRQLTIAQAVQLLERGQRGDTALLQWTFRFIERRYPTLSALLSRCESPLLNFDWEIQIKDELPSNLLMGWEPPIKNRDAGEDDESEKDEPQGATTEEMEKDKVRDLAKAQQAALREAYEAVDNLKDAIKHLHLAEFRGYSHLQKHRTNDGDVSHLETLHQWCVCRDGLYGDWFWNPDSRSVTMPATVVGEENRIGGDQLPMEDFIVYEVDRPIDEIALISFVRANLCEKDWDGFIEIYGIPGGVVVMPGNVPQGKESEYEMAAQKVAEGGSGAIPNGAEYKPNDGPRGVDPFTPRLKHLDEHLIMAGTGGKLTMLAESGSGTLAGAAHSDTFEDIADARAQKISEIFQRGFDVEVLNREFPGQPVLAYFRLVARDRDSSESVGFKRDVLKSLAAHEIFSRVLGNQLDLKETVRDAGLEVNEEYTDPYVPVIESDGALVTGELERDEKGDIIGAVPEQGSGSTPVDRVVNRGNRPRARIQRRIINGDANRSRPELPKLEENAGDEFAQALADDLQTVRERIEALEQITDDTILRNRAMDLIGELENLKADINKLPKAAQVLAEMQVAALFTGLTEKRK